MAATWLAAFPTISVRMRGSPARLKSMVWAPRRRVGLIGRIALGFQHTESGQPVQSAGIQMREAEMDRQLLGQGALAAGRGPVDGDDDRLEGGLMALP
jgi:hypothetical protein